MAVIRITSSGDRLHSGLQVLADVRRADRLQELQPGGRVHGQPVGGPDALHQVRELLPVRPGRRQHPVDRGPGPAGGLPDPDHPGIAGQSAPEREVQEVHPDGALLPRFHLHRRGGRHHVRGPLPQIGAGEQRDPAGRRRADLLHGLSGVVPPHLRDLGCLAERRLLDDRVPGGPGRPSTRRFTTRPRSTVPRSSSASGTSICRASCRW